MIFFWARIQDIIIWLKSRKYVRSIYFGSIEKKFSATGSGGDTAIAFGCELDLFSF